MRDERILRKFGGWESQSGHPTGNFCWCMDRAEVQGRDNDRSGRDHVPALWHRVQVGSPSIPGGVVRLIGV